MLIKGTFQKTLSKVDFLTMVKGLLLGKGDKVIPFIRCSKSLEYKE